MLANLRRATALLLGTILLLLGVGLLNTLITLRGEALEFSVTMIGALMSLYYVGYFAGTFTISLLVHRVGHIRAFAFCTTLVAALVLVQALTSSYVVWLVLRVFQGLALVGLYAIIESWLNAAYEPVDRSPIFSIYMMLNLGSLALGQQFLRIDAEPFVLFSVVAILFCLATLPVAATRQVQPEVQEVPSINVRRLYRRTPTALVAALLSGLILGALWGLLPLYARAIGFDTTHVGTYMTVAIGGGVLLQWPLGRFSDRIDRRLALTIISALAALVAMAALFLSGVSAATAFALIFLFGGLSFALYPIAVAHLVDYLPKEELISASSTVLLAYGVGSAIGPLAAGTLMSRVQPGLLFAWFAGLCLLLAGYALYRFLTRKRDLVEDNHFVPMLRTTPAVLDLHPDTEPENDTTDESVAPAA